MKIHLESAPIDRVLPRLHEVTEDGDGWLARCPAKGHEDHHPSLRVDVGDDDNVLLYCRSQGCPTQDIVAGMGLTLADLFARVGGRSAAADPAYYQPKGSDEHRAFVDKYGYTDEQGELLYIVGRTAEKDFPVWHPESGSYAWGYGGRRVLYHLPEVVATVASGDTVHICAGEKDADAVRRTGATATTYAGGEANWRAEYAEPLRGADIVLWQDKDEAGRRRTRKVVESLERVGATVRVVEAAAGKDAADHLDAGHTLDDVVLVDPETGVGAGEVGASPLRWLRGPELAALTPEEPDYIVAPYLARGLVVQLAGKVKGGKTTLAMHMAAAVLNKHSFLERP